MESRRTRPRARFLPYGFAGWAVDSLFVFVHTGRRRPSSLLNVPVYALAQPLFEPVHNRIRHRPVALRAALYGVGILGVEYTSGRLLRRFAGSAPWDYGRTRFGIDVGDGVRPSDVSLFSRSPTTSRSSPSRIKSHLCWRS